MKLDVKKTGLIIAVSGALMVGSVFANENEDDSKRFSKLFGMMDELMAEKKRVHVYGKFGLELHNTSEKAGENFDTVGGLGFKDGGNRFGANFSKFMEGGAVKSVVGTIEFQTEVDPDEGGWNLEARHANVAIHLRNKGTLTLGQQSNLRVSSGDMSKSWTGSDSALKRSVNGSRYTGVSYVQNFGIGLVGLMVGVDNTDDGQKRIPAAVRIPNGAGADTRTVLVDLPEGAKKDNQFLDNLSFLLSVSPMKALEVQLAYDSKKGDSKKYKAEESDISLGVGYSMGPISAHLGFASRVTNNSVREYKNGFSGAKREISFKEQTIQSVSLNAKFDAGVVQPFVGVRQSAYETKFKRPSGGTVKSDFFSNAEVAISAGVNFEVLGGQSVFQLDVVSNVDGVEDAEKTRFLTGLFYEF